MVSWLRTPVQSEAVHIVILAWLYVIFTVALTLSSLAAGAALFVVVGLAPALLWLALRIRRLRAQRERAASEGARARSR
jgi:heme O synthase-like polyprenyltransferase